SLRSLVLASVSSALPRRVRQSGVCAGSQGSPSPNNRSALKEASSRLSSRLTPHGDSAVIGFVRNSISAGSIMAHKVSSPCQAPGYGMRSFFFSRQPNRPLAGSLTALAALQRREKAISNLVQSTRAGILDCRVRKVPALENRFDLIELGARPIAFVGVADQ